MVTTFEIVTFSQSEGERVSRVERPSIKQVRCEAASAENGGGAFTPWR